MELCLDNSHSNLVELTFYDHALAHYYLCKCTVGELKYRLQYAFLVMVNSSNMPECAKNAIKLISDFNELMQRITEDISSHNTQYSEHKYINNGKKTKHVPKDEVQNYLKNG